MRTKTAFIITLVTDPKENNEIAGKLEFVENGERITFCNWDELKAVIIESLLDDANPGRLRSNLRS